MTLFQRILSLTTILAMPHFMDASLASKGGSALKRQQLVQTTEGTVTALDKEFNDALENMVTGTRGAEDIVKKLIQIHGATRPDLQEKYENTKKAIAATETDATRRSALGELTGKVPATLTKKIEGTFKGTKEAAEEERKKKEEEARLKEEKEKAAKLKAAEEAAKEARLKREEEEARLKREEAELKRKTKEAARLKAAEEERKKKEGELINLAESFDGRTKITPIAQAKNLPTDLFTATETRENLIKNVTNAYSKQVSTTLDSLIKKLKDLAVTDDIKQSNQEFQKRLTDLNMAIQNIDPAFDEQSSVEKIKQAAASAENRFKNDINKELIAIAQSFKKTSNVKPITLAVAYKISDLSAINETYTRTVENIYGTSWRSTQIETITNLTTNLTPDNLLISNDATKKVYAAANNLSEALDQESDYYKKIFVPFAKQLKDASDKYYEATKPIQKTLEEFTNKVNTLNAQTKLTEIYSLFLSCITEIKNANKKYETTFANILTTNPQFWDNYKKIFTTEVIGSADTKTGITWQLTTVRGGYFGGKANPQEAKNIYDNAMRTNITQLLKDETELLKIPALRKLNDAMIEYYNNTIVALKNKVDAAMPKTK